MWNTLTKKCPTADRWLYCQDTCFLLRPHESEFLFTGSTVMPGLILSLSLLSDWKSRKTVPQWHNSTQLSLQCDLTRKREIPLFSWRILEKRKRGSQPSDAGGILSSAFKPGKSIKLSKNGYKVLYTSHLPDIIDKWCSVSLSLCYYRSSERLRTTIAQQGHFHNFTSCKRSTHLNNVRPQEGPLHHYIFFLTHGLHSHYMKHTLFCLVDCFDFSYSA